MLLKSLVALGLVGAIVASATELIWAAVPSKAIKDWQDGAPEAVIVTVLSKDESAATRPLTTRPGGPATTTDPREKRPASPKGATPGGSMTVTTTNVTLTAKVDVVHRTASGLAPGSVIIVRYEMTRYTPPPGPPDGSRGIALNVGERATAYLKQMNDNNFQLACPFGCLLKL